MTADSVFHRQRVRTLGGEVMDFASLRGKVVLVVNTASHCRLATQFDGLEALYTRHCGDGFVVLGFPSDQFGLEPGSALEIEAHCLLQHGVSFPMFEKTVVNGRQAHPLFRWLTTSLPGRLGRSVKWNFTKFLIDRDGRPLRRYAPLTTPKALERELVDTLRGNAVSSRSDM